MARFPTAGHADARSRKCALVTGIGWCRLVCLFGLIAKPAEAIPAFSRQHRPQCGSCHTVIPQLTSVGEQFRAAGFRLSPEL